MLNSANYFSHLFIITYSLLFLGQTFKAVWLDVHVLPHKIQFWKIMEVKNSRVEGYIKVLSKKAIGFHWQANLFKLNFHIRKISWHQPVKFARCPTFNETPALVHSFLAAGCNNSLSNSCLLQPKYLNWKVGNGK